MLKKILLAFGLSLITSSAWAACGAIPLTIKDAANATQNISSATAADGNCKTYIDADTSSQLHTDLTAPLATQAATVTIGGVGIVQGNPTSGTLQSAAVANGNGSSLATAGMSSAILTVNCATCSGGTTVNFEGTQDGANYTAISSVQIGTNTIAITTATSGVTMWEMPVAGFSGIRARISGYSAGTVTITGTTLPLPNTPKVVNANVVNTPAVAPTAQEVHLGEIASNQIKVQVAQTVTASAYSAGNALGGLMTVASAARVSGSAGAAGTGGILTGLQLNSKAAQSGVQVDVFIFDANPTGSTCTDKSAFVLATADFDKVVGVLTIPSTPANGAGWFSGGTGSVGIPTYFPVTYDLASSTSIYACAVVRAAITPNSTSDISFKFNALRN